MLRLTQIDLVELGGLLDDRHDPSGYLDPRTGETYRLHDDATTDATTDETTDETTDDERVLDGFAAGAADDLLPVGGDGAHEAFRDMEIFTAWLGDGRLRQDLSRALDGPRPIEEFTEIVESAPHRTGAYFNGFHQIRSQLRALDFLSGCDLVAVPEIEERRTQLSDAGDALLANLGGGARPRLILLNGLPGVGKSTLARAYVATRPGTLNLDIDVLRTMLGGRWEETAELGRSLALEVIAAHLRSGHDVVVPQLVADRAQLRRFEKVAADFDFVLVIVEGESRTGAQPWQVDAAAEEWAHYRTGLDQLVSRRRGIHRVRVDADTAAAVARLEGLLQDS